MLDRLQDLWAERPAVVAAAVIAPLTFLITLLVLLVVVDGSPDDSSQQAQSESVAQPLSDEQQAQPAQSSTVQKTTIAVETSADSDDQPQSVAQATQQSSGQGIVQVSSDDDQPGPDTEQQQTDVGSDQEQTQQQQADAEDPEPPLMIAGHVVEPLAGVLAEPIDEEALRHGSDGSEGGILPIDNGVVVSSGPLYQTRWELIVPSAGLKSSIVRVGRTNTGAMGSPDNPYVIGWLDSSAKPGEDGNMLLAGHRDFEDSEGNVGTGVCWELINTVEGDHMLVHDSARNIYYVYTVTEVATVNPRDRASARYLQNTEQHVVTLITCEGSFNAETHQYSHRRVVVGELTNVAADDA